jgi:hypothetical protein
VAKIFFSLIGELLVVLSIFCAFLISMSESREEPIDPITPLYPPESHFRAHDLSWLNEPILGPDGGFATYHEMVPSERAITYPIIIQDEGCQFNGTANGSTEPIHPTRCIQIENRIICFDAPSGLLVLELREECR